MDTLPTQWKDKISDPDFLGNIRDCICLTEFFILLIGLRLLTSDRSKTLNAEQMSSTDHFMGLSHDLLIMKHDYRSLIDALMDLNDDLMDSNDDLMDSNGDLMDSNDDLMDSNDDLMDSNDDFNTQSNSSSLPIPVCD